MADLYDKKTIFSKLKEKVESKGFKLDVQKGDKKGIAKSTPTVVDILEIVSESLSEVLKEGDMNAIMTASDFKIGPGQQQKELAYKTVEVKFDSTTDPKFFAWMEQLHGLLQAVYPEAGYGAPDVFALALKSLASSKPTSITGKIVEGSSKVKIDI